MSDVIQRHISRYPQARPSTLAHLAKRAEMTDRLKKEIAAEKREQNRLYQIVKRTGLWIEWMWK